MVLITLMSMKTVRQIIVGSLGHYKRLCSFFGILCKALHQDSCMYNCICTNINMIIVQLYSISYVVSFIRLQKSTIMRAIPARTQTSFTKTLPLYCNTAAFSCDKLVIFIDTVKYTYLHTITLANSITQQNITLRARYFLSDGGRRIPRSNCCTRNHSMKLSSLTSRSNVINQQ